MKNKSSIVGWFIFILLAACAPSTPAATPAPTALSNADAVYKDSSQPVEVRVADLLGRMNLEEKIGQMTQVPISSIDAGDIYRYSIGSILSGGSDAPADNTPEGWTAVVDGVQKEALSTRLGIPLIYGIDAVHGVGHLIGATVFPQEVSLGATHDPELLRLIGRATAEEMLALGIPWNFAPVIAVPQDVRWGRTYEAYGEDTALVTDLGAAYIRGLQSIPAGMTAAPGQTIGVLASAKHYVGDGATVWGSSGIDWYFLDQGNMQASEETLHALYLPPYEAAVKAGAMNVMISFSSWNGIKMHGNRFLIMSVLKGEMGFQGFTISDWGGIAQINPEDYYDSVVRAVNAGIDMGMIPENYISFIDIIKSAVNTGDITPERIDDAVTRILRVKFLLGLFDHPYSDPQYQSTVRSAAHVELARRAVRESLVLLKNEGQALPIDQNASTILVSGLAADDTGIQSGGWTLGWQGAPGNDVVGSTIWDGIRKQAGSQTKVIYRSSGIFDDIPGKAPVGIAVVGEIPYAEGEGDATDLRLPQEDVDLINRLRAKVDQLIVIIVSGRPRVISDLYQTADAWVAAWLPGSEGAAVADVLFGDYPFVGQTPYTWPRSNDQLPINKNNSDGRTGCEAPLFPYGFGLGEAGSTPIQWVDCSE